LRRAEVFSWPGTSIGFALVLAILAAVIGLGLTSMASVDTRVKQIVDDNNVKIFAAGGAQPRASIGRGRQGDQGADRWLGRQGRRQEQAAGIEQVNQAIVQMDGVTQQNAVLIEEAAAAAQALQDRAADLSHAVGVFRLDVPRRGA
jgi:hypothetical protein